MSGNAFKDFEIERINHCTYKEIKQIIGEIFQDFEEIGSSQRFKSEYLWDVDETIGDLDLAVGLSKDKIIETIQNNSIFKTHRVFGNTVSTIIEFKNKLYHIDLMTSSNTKHESWIMTGGSGKIKGVMRNILLSFLARQVSEKYSSEETTLKFTIAYPGGIGLSINGQKIKERSTSPKDILSTLELDHNPWDIIATETFEGLVEYVEWTHELFQKFCEYSKSQWLYKKSPEVIEDALSFLETRYINRLDSQEM